ncbi:MAG: ribonuclease H-like domain-containing protein [Clostridia bacterium]|nr:ribonuclease H-like domain-containing protein [Clostridia bacterium]
MRNLREKLMAVSASRPRTLQKLDEPNPEPFFCREHVVPLEELCGIERVSLADIRACDPGFVGEHWDISKVLFVDTETTGLNGGAGTVAFEIGVGWIGQQGMIIRQYVIRDYCEEAAMLREIAALFEKADTVVSFNGKTFDLPLLESRMVMNRIRMPLTQMPHLDLLHASRRVYKLRLKRCNLSALEEAIFGFSRKDDLPGAQVPQRYFDYLKTREFALLEDVLRHNLDDVRSLARLTGHLCAVFKTPQMLEHAEDLFGVGRTLMRGGDVPKARACFRILRHSSLSAQAHMHLVSSYKRDRQWEETISSCQEMIACGEGGIWPYVELAKYYEHIERDVPRAFGYANAALRYALNMAPISGMDPEIEKQLQKRLERLRRKMKRQNDHSV